MRRYGRQGLLRFGVAMAGEIRFARLDNGSSVELAYFPQSVPRPSGLAELMREALAPQADAATREAFAEAWQDWVRTTLIDHADDAALITVEHRLAPAGWSEATPEHSVGCSRDPCPKQRAQNHRADGSRLVLTSAPCMDAEGGKHQARRDGDEDGQRHRPAPPPPQPQTAGHLGEPGDEVEPEHKRHDGPGGKARRFAAEQCATAGQDRQPAEEHCHHGQ